MDIFTGRWDLDLKILEEYISKLKYETGTNRMKKFKIPKSQGGSILMGYTWMGYLSKDKKREWCPIKRRFKTKLLSENPELWELLKEFQKLWFRDFEFSGVQLNKNYKIPRHIDGANQGESVLVCCGNYIGGNTIVEIDNEEIVMDGREKPIRFDGSKYYHWVSDFEGDRYSLVFFRDCKV
tara:strand:+ start:2446 stop:2988 length:543 start_codon:yes stop_codon:yes gene_type:complete